VHVVNGYGVLNSGKCEEALLYLSEIKVKVIKMNYLIICGFLTYQKMAPLEGEVLTI